MEPSRQATAYHEAGHGVVAYRFGHYLDILSIVPDDDGRLGFSRSEGTWIVPSKELMQSKDRQQIVVLYAGFAAQRRFDRNADREGSESDDEEADQLLQFQPEGTTEAVLRSEAERLVHENWPQIEAVAAALLEYGTLVDGWDIIIDAVDEGLDWLAEWQVYLFRLGLGRETKT